MSLMEKHCYGFRPKIGKKPFNVSLDGLQKIAEPPLEQVC
jgi:hypothetical protein